MSLLSDWSKNWIFVIAAKRRWCFRSSQLVTPGNASTIFHILLPTPWIYGVFFPCINLGARRKYTSCRAAWTNFALPIKNAFRRETYRESNKISKFKASYEISFFPKNIFFDCFLSWLRVTAGVLFPRWVNRPWSTILRTLSFLCRLLTVAVHSCSVWCGCFASSFVSRIVF